MKGLRLAIAAVAVAVILPTGFLVQRALESVAFERDVRHQAVADRSFDEMERVLSGFLAQEEDRPFEAYGFYREPAGGETRGETARSALSHAPALPFVRGYFQIDPDGSIHSPEQPRDGEPPPAGWEIGAEGLARIDGVREVVQLSWRRKGKRSFEDPAERQADADASAPELSVLEKVQDKESEDETVGKDSTAYGVLSRLNLASEQRAERKQKTQFAKARKVAEGQSAANGPSHADLQVAPQTTTREDRESSSRSSTVSIESSSGSFLFESFGELAELAADDAPVDEEVVAGLELDSVAKSEAAGRSRGESAERLAEAEREPTKRDAARSLGASAPAVVEEPATPRPARDARLAAELMDALAPGVSKPGEAEAAAEEWETVRITLDPMMSRPADAGSFILYRTVLVGEQGIRQGMVIDRTALGDWLRAQVVEAGGLSSWIELAFESGGGGEIFADDRFVYRHDFAEPFQALRAELRLLPLPGLGSSTAIYLLAALLVVASGLGLLALYRMVAVALHFAERRNNFVAAVSHELKTPLTSIRMYAEMLRDGLVSSEDKREEYYATITQESERLSRLVDNVLEFSRLEKGGRPTAESVGDLRQLVAEVAEKLSPHAERHGFELFVEADSDLPPIRFDRDAVTQLLFNLVDNAIKYASRAPRREICLACRRADGGAMLTVRDFGPGVSKRHLQKIFEPFYRGEDELTRSAKGSGIGLALVRELAQSMGAGVACDNPEDGGFRVRIDFPAASAA